MPSVCIAGEALYGGNRRTPIAIHIDNFWMIYGVRYLQVDITPEMRIALVSPGNKVRLELCEQITLRDDKMQSDIGLLALLTNSPRQWCQPDTETNYDHIEIAAA